MAWYKNNFTVERITLLALIVIGGIIFYHEYVLPKKCPPEKPYPITDFGGKWTGECSETLVMS